MCDDSSDMKNGIGVVRRPEYDNQSAEDNCLVWVNSVEIVNSGTVALSADTGSTQHAVAQSLLRDINVIIARISTRINFAYLKDNYYDHGTPP